MTDNGRLYDPHGGQQPANGRTAAIQETIHATTQTLQSNIAAMGERGARLDNLQEQSAGLANNAHSFNRRANQLRKDMWWKDMKMRVCIIVGIIILLVVIIVPSVVATHHN